MILEKKISILIKHETFYKDQTDLPQENFKQLSEKELKEQDSNNVSLVNAVLGEMKDIMKVGGLDEEG